jgi:hypothetical protein
MWKPPKPRGRFRDLPGVDRQLRENSLTLRYKQHAARALVVSRECEAAQVEDELMVPFDRYAALSWRLKEPGSDDILNFIFNLRVRSFSNVNVTNSAVFSDIKTYIQDGHEA